MKKLYTIEEIKKIGKEKNNENLLLLIELYNQRELPTNVLREVVSSIGRNNNLDVVHDFLMKNAFTEKLMDLVYQMFRTSLYKSAIDQRFSKLRKDMIEFYDNEMINRMDLFYTYRKKNKTLHTRQRMIKDDLVLIGDNRETLKTLPDQSIQLVFTSPPYYNARDYSNYKNYKEYLITMKETLLQCHRVLENGRFIVINVSPVITKRPGREFESIRYPIHFDFNKILEESGFYFVDEVIWKKPEYTVINRNGSFIKSKMPLKYKPNNITESVMVYRKNAPFLLEENLVFYGENDIIPEIDSSKDRTNVWEIHPKSSKLHPAIFPGELCEKVLKLYSFKNDVILDPFAGSGTLRKVAKKYDRLTVLCEINPNYINKL